MPITSTTRYYVRRHYEPAKPLVFGEPPEVRLAGITFVGSIWREDLERYRRSALWHAVGKDGLRETLAKLARTGGKVWRVDPVTEHVAEVTASDALAALS